jgi:hypothetical protein
MGKHKSRNAEEVMEAVLARLNQIEDRMAQQEAEAAEAEGRQVSGSYCQCC